MATNEEPVEVKEEDQVVITPATEEEPVEVKEEDQVVITPATEEEPVEVKTEKTAAERANEVKKTITLSDLKLNNQVVPTGKTSSLVSSSDKITNSNQSSTGETEQDLDLDSVEVDFERLKNLYNESGSIADAFLGAYGSPDDYKKDQAEKLAAEERALKRKNNAAILLETLKVMGDGAAALKGSNVWKRNGVQPLIDKNAEKLDAKKAAYDAALTKFNDDLLAAKSADKAQEFSLLTSLFPYSGKQNTSSDSNTNTTETADSISLNDEESTAQRNKGNTTHVNTGGNASKTVRNIVGNRKFTEDENNTRTYTDDQVEEFELKMSNAELDGRVTDAKNDKKLTDDDIFNHIMDSRIESYSGGNNSINTTSDTQYYNELTKDTYTKLLKAAIKSYRNKGVIDDLIYSTGAGDGEIQKFLTIFNEKNMAIYVLDAAILKPTSDTRRAMLASGQIKQITTNKGVRTKDL